MYYQSYQKLFLVLCCLVIFGSASVGLMTALRAGPAWDDPTELHVFNGFLELADQPDLSYQAGREKLDGYSPGAGYYGVVPQSLAHVLDAVVSGSQWSKAVEPTVSSIARRHVISILLALISATTIFVTVFLVAGESLPAFTAVAVLLSTPVFLGLSSIDIKDGPLAAGMTIFSCGCALILSQLRNNSQIGPLPGSPAARILAGLAIFVGTFLTLGTRAGSAPLLAVQGIVLCAALAIFFRSDKHKVIVLSAVFGGAAFAGTVLAILANPLARKAPIRWIVESATFAAHFPTGVTPLRLYGETIFSNAIPWWYSPGWMIVEYPIAFLVLIVLGTIVPAYRRCILRSRTVLLPWLPFIVQGLVLPICVFVSGAVLYDRLRHLLFIVPAVCMLAGAGLYYCVITVGTNRRWVKLALAALAPTLLLFNFASTVLWYPYQYAYLNAFGRSFPQFAFDTDYWGLTMQEGVQRMGRLGINSFRVGPAPLTALYNTPEFGFALDLVSASYPAYPRPVSGGGAYYVHSRPSWGAAGLPDFCETLFQIKRQGVVLGAGGRC
jgi:hypothetical protein